jgi:hypothetical protein
MDTLDGQLNPDTPAGARTRLLTHRDRAILRAVGRGSAEIVLGAEPDLFLEGRCCSDQMAAHHLVRAGLIVAAAPGVVGQRVSARLSAAGSRLSAGEPRDAGSAALAARAVA